MSARDAAVAVTRFGLGAAPGEIRAAAGDPRGWVLEQIGGAGPQVGPGLSPSHEILVEVRRLRRRRNGQDAADSAREHRHRVRAIYRDETAARFAVATATGRPFAERLVRFWSNHFTVAASKTATIPVVGAFEREAIRPHVFRRFRDLLVAAEQHPAMILYLDNHISFGPSSRVGRRREHGLNENLAREILELHTVGVDGGYTQQDVTSFARVLTGWTIAHPRLFPEEAGRFHFVGAVHEPGTHRVMGRRYAEDGVAQPMAVLKDLARHPKTAEHVATKLARHFIADDPPAGAVARLTRVFQVSEGDLVEVSAAVVRERAAWEQVQNKVKSPSDYVLSCLRGVDVPEVAPEKVLSSLKLLGQKPFGAPSPAGWPDRAEHWAGPDALMRRIEWAQLIGGRLARTGTEPFGLAEDLLGPLLSRETAAAIRRAESRSQAFSLLLASPELMRR